MIYALDANAISYFIRGNERVTLHIKTALENRDDIIIPPVAYYEIRRGFGGDRLSGAGR
jgi:predicted nucleic acid-binding protein